jgi:chromosome segregation ATPase
LLEEAADAMRADHAEAVSVLKTESADALRTAEEAHADAVAGAVTSLSQHFAFLSTSSGTRPLFGTLSASAVDWQHVLRSLQGVHSATIVELESLRSERASLAEKLDESVHDLIAARKLCDDTEKIRVRLDVACDEYRTQIQDLGSRVTELERSLRDAERQLDSSLRDTDKERALARDAYAKLEQAALELKVERNSADAYRKKLHELEQQTDAEKSDLRKEIFNITSSRTTQAEQLQQLQLRAGSMQEQLVGLEMEKRRLQAALAEHSAVRDNHGSPHQGRTVNGRHNEGNGVAAAVEASVVSTDGSLNELPDARALQDENADLKKQIAQLVSSLTDAEDQQNALVARLQDAESSKKSTEDDIARYKRQVEEYQIVVMEADDEVEMAAKELVLQQQQSERLQSQLTSKEEELRYTSEKLSTLQTELADSQRHAAASEGELVVAAERIAELLEQQEEGTMHVDRAATESIVSDTTEPPSPQLWEDIEAARTEAFAEREAKMAAERKLLEVTQAAARTAADLEAAQGESLAQAERNHQRVLSELRAEGMEAQLELASETDRAQRLADELASARAKLASTTAQLLSTTGMLDESASKCRCLAEEVSAAKSRAMEWQCEAERLAKCLAVEDAARTSRDEEEALALASAEADAEAALATMHGRVASLKRNLAVLTAASVAASGAFVSAVSLDAVAI